MAWPRRSRYSAAADSAVIGASISRRAGLPFGVEDQLHQQHALVEEHRPRDADALSVELEERVGLDRLPGLFLGGASEAAAAFDRALGAAVPDRAPLLVFGVVLEAALIALLVDLGGQHLAAVAHQEDVGLLAALQLGHDLVEDPFREQQFEARDHAGSL